MIKPPKDILFPIWSIRWIGGTAFCGEVDLGCKKKKYEGEKNLIKGER